MRPQDLRNYLVDLLKNSSDVQRVEVLEGGRHPYALAASVGGKELRWQVIGQLADGAKHATPTPPVQSGPPAYTMVSAAGAPDAWLAAVIGAAEPADVEGLDVWSARKQQSDPGLTVSFHNGERAFVRLL